MHIHCFILLYVYTTEANYRTRSGRETKSLKGTSTCKILLKQISYSVIITFLIVTQRNDKFLQLPIAYIEESNF